MSILSIYLPLSYLSICLPICLNLHYLSILYLPIYINHLHFFPSRHSGLQYYYITLQYYYIRVLCISFCPRSAHSSCPEWLSPVIIAIMVPSLLKLLSSTICSKISTMTWWAWSSSLYLLFHIAEWQLLRAISSSS